MNSNQGPMIIALVCLVVGGILILGWQQGWFSGEDEGGSNAPGPGPSGPSGPSGHSGEGGEGGEGGEEGGNGSPGPSDGSPGPSEPSDGSPGPSEPSEPSETYVPWPLESKTMTSSCRSV